MPYWICATGGIVLTSSLLAWSNRRQPQTAIWIHRDLSPASLDDTVPLLIRYRWPSRWGEEGSYPSWGIIDISRYRSDFGGQCTNKRVVNHRSRSVWYGCGRCLIEVRCMSVAEYSCYLVHTHIKYYGRNGRVRSCVYTALSRRIRRNIDVDLNCETKHIITAEVLDWTILCNGTDTEKCQNTFNGSSIVETSQYSCIKIHVNCQ